MSFLRALSIAGIALAAAPLAVPVDAARVTRTTTVTRVHGPMKVLPHHDRKVCRVRWVNHHRSQKCWYR